MRELEKNDQRLSIYFNAVTFLHVAYKTTRNPLTDELLDVLATTCLQSNDVRRCQNARHSSMLSLRQAVRLMQVVANKSRSTVQLIEIELSKAYLYRALRCKDYDRDSIYCLAHVYLAVLYCNTGQYQMAIDHCTLAMTSQCHSQCNLHIVQGEILPKIDENIDTVLGLAVFYQYVRTSALSQQQQTQHDSVFNTVLFAHYLHLRCLSVMKCRQVTQTSSTHEFQRYQKCFYELQEIFTTDVLLLNLLNHTRNNQRQVAVSGQSKSMPGASYGLDTSELVELLQQSAHEHLAAFRQLDAQEFISLSGTVATDFEALYAYKCGEHQRCLQLSTYNVRALIGVGGISNVHAYPEFIQLMDDDIVSLTGLTLLVNPYCRYFPLHDLLSKSNISYRAPISPYSVFQLNLSLYLMTQCQMKLHHSVSSLAQTLEYVKVARLHVLDEAYTLDQLVLKLIERKILLYIRENLA